MNVLMSLYQINAFSERILLHPESPSPWHCKISIDNAPDLLLLCDE
jgi:hypothetical protein